MNLKSGQSNPPADGGAYEYPIDSCDHIFSTSLRDLSLKYQNLSPEQVDSGDLNKKESAKDRR